MPSTGCPGPAEVGSNCKRSGTGRSVNNGEAIPRNKNRPVLLSMPMPSLTTIMLDPTTLPPSSGASPSRPEFPPRSWTGGPKSDGGGKSRGSSSPTTRPGPNWRRFGGWSPSPGRSCPRDSTRRTLPGPWPSRREMCLGWAARRRRRRSARNRPSRRTRRRLANPKKEKPRPQEAPPGSLTIRSRSSPGRCAPSSPTCSSSPIACPERRTPTADICRRDRGRAYDRSLPKEGPNDSASTSTTSWRPSLPGR